MSCCVTGCQNVATNTVNFERFQKVLCNFHWSKYEILMEDINFWDSVCPDEWGWNNWNYNYLDRMSVEGVGFTLAVVYCCRYNWLEIGKLLCQSSEELNSFYSWFDNLKYDQIIHKALSSLELNVNK